MAAVYRDHVSVKQAGFVDRLIAHFGPDTRFDEIDAWALRKAASRLYPGCTPATHQRQLYSVFRAVHSFYHGTWSRRSGDRPRTRWLTPEEAERLLDAAARLQERLKDPDGHNRRVIAFMLCTGTCPGETAVVQAADFNWRTSQCRIRAEQLGAAKTAARARWTRLPARGVALMAGLPASGPAFRTPKGVPYRLRAQGGTMVPAQFRAIREAAGLDRAVIPYTLRHTFATWFGAHNASDQLLCDLGGWSDPRTVRRYRKLAPDDLAQSLLEHGWDFRAKSGQSSIREREN